MATWQWRRAELALTLATERELETMAALAESEMRAAEPLLRTVRNAEALTHCQATIGYWTRLTEAKPHEPRYAVGLARALVAQAESLSLIDGRKEECGESAAAGVAVWEELVRRQPNDISHRRGLARALVTKATSLGLVEADDITVYSQAIQLLTTDPRATADDAARDCLAEAYQSRGWRYYKTMRYGEALADYRESERLDLVKHPALAGHPWVRRSQAERLKVQLRTSEWRAALGEVERYPDPRSWLAAGATGHAAILSVASEIHSDRGREFADQAVKRLRDGVESGEIAYPEFITQEPAFESLKGHRDFRNLMTKLRAKHDRNELAPLPRPAG